MKQLLNTTPMLRRLLPFMAAVLFAGSVMAQATTVYTEAYESYKRAAQFFDEGLYAKAQSEYRHAIDLLRPVNEADAELLRTKSELGFAQSAVRLEQPDGEKLILQFIRNYSPDPIANQALVEIANYYFDSKEYDKAISYLSKVPTTGMSREEKAAIKFKLGYAHFVGKNFSQAKMQFREIKDLDTDYYYPTNYYLGLCYFYEGGYDEAIRQFRLVEKSNTYNDYIPYYTAQIYFAERRFDELIAYAEPRLSDPNIKNQKEIYQLVGQAHFEKGNYSKALPYLQYYADRSSKLRAEEFYQLGYTQYKTGDYTKAIRSLQEVSAEDSEMGQAANYYLGEAYLRQGNRASARAAFGNAKRMNYDKGLAEEANFNYGKLSYEMKDPQEAISSLQLVDRTSPYYVEAQTLMGDIFLTYRNYEQALAILDAMPNKPPQLRESHQKVMVLRGIQLLQDNRMAEAKSLFTRSLEFPIDSKSQAMALFWLADIAHKEGNYAESIRLNTQFITLAKTVTGLPDESSLFTGNYLQGYNYLKQDNYPSALEYFRNTVEGIKRNRAFIASEAVREDVLGDAVLRTGDAYFKRNQYNQAIQYYDEAVNNRYSGFIYALYQKALLEGLRNQHAQKIIALEQIVSEYPNSEYADDALYQIALTYVDINQPNRAIEPLRRLVSQYKNSSDLVVQSYLRLGLINYNIGNQEAAINYYKQVFANNPSAEEANVALAALDEIYVTDMGRPDLLEAFLRTIPNYNFNDFSRDSLFFRSAETQYENGNYQRAVESYQNYLSQFPNGLNVLEAHYHKAESHGVLRQYDQALTHYEWVVARGTSRFYLKALEKAALIAYNHSQDFDKSYDLYTKLEQAADTEEMRFEAQLGGMRSAYRMGNTQAVYTLAGKVANNARATDVQKATANFYMGKIAFDRSDYTAALTAFNETIRLSDNEQTAEARYLRAFIYYQRRDLNTAKELTLAANRESSGYPYWVAKCVILLSDIFVEQGDLYNGRAALEALLDNYNEDQAVVAEARQKLNRVNNMINSGSRLDASDPNRLEFDGGGQ
ncbi:MAG: tetratricopeptide repeat protein [Saprospiraceae bacterium]